MDAADYTTKERELLANVEQDIAHLTEKRTQLTTQLSTANSDLENQRQIQQSNSDAIKAILNNTEGGYQLSLHKNPLSMLEQAISTHGQDENILGDSFFVAPERNTGSINDDDTNVPERPETPQEICVIEPEAYRADRGRCTLSINGKQINNRDDHDGKQSLRAFTQLVGNTKSKSSVASCDEDTQKAKAIQALMAVVNQSTLADYMQVSRYHFLAMESELIINIKGDNDTPLIYDISTDEQGNFVISAIETGRVSSILYPSGSSINMYCEPKENDKATALAPSATRIINFTLKKEAVFQGQTTVLPGSLTVKEAIVVGENSIKPTVA